DALIISDYDKGCLTPAILTEVLAYASTLKVPILVDPKFRNLDSYRPATFVTPNHHEVLRYAGFENDSDDFIVTAARSLCSRLGCRSVLVTRGSEGMMLLDENREPVFVKAAAREVYDVTGAGDTCIATLAAATAAGATSLESAILANHAAGVVVGKVGTATTTTAEIIASLKTTL
ncbi:MAG: bifunctional heptose 7-phosphate kinase/heptose 1-phosphate adenyltransferase, partial [Pyrinomonadaceae bacterium]